MTRLEKSRHLIRIARGALYIERETCDLYLPDISAVALLQREGLVFLLPLRGASAGGCLLKQRNVRGDRVVHVPEFLRSIGIDESAPDCSVSASWVSEMAALRLDGLPGHVGEDAC